MARALGTSERKALAPVPTATRPPGPGLQRVLDLVHQAYREASRLSSTDDPDAADLSGLATVLLGVGRLALEGREPGKTLMLGGAGGRGLSILVSPQPPDPSEEIEQELRALAADAKRALMDANRRHGPKAPASRHLAFWASLLGKLVMILDREKEGHIPFVGGEEGELHVGLVPFVPRPVALPLPAAPARLRLLKGGER